MQPRLDIAERHIELLTGSADTPCCFRLLGGMGNRNLFGTLRHLWPEFCAGQEFGSQIYVLPNEGGHTAADITRVRALFVDADGVPTPTKWHAEPDFIVRRDATHWHAYWRVADMPTSPDFKIAQQRLAVHYRTDPKVCDLPRIMRLAGTLHLKDPAHPHLITIEAGANA